MSDNAFFVWLWLMFTLWIFAFNGDPDIHDAIVKYLLSLSQ